MIALTPQNCVYQLLVQALKVKTNYLLHEHDKERGLSRSSISGNCEHLPPQMFSFAELLLHS